jgi:hypothetical protein
MMKVKVTLPASRPGTYFDSSNKPKSKVAKPPPPSKKPRKKAQAVKHKKVDD